MENYKRRVVSCVDEDRISNLPDHLIDSIFERLPIEDAIRTSILSKKWRYTWTKMRTLLFDQQFVKSFAKNGAFGHNGFIRIINKVVIFHQGPILKFHLHIPYMINLDSFQEVDQWMLLLSRSQVKELILTNSNLCYELPSYVFSCLELTKLVIMGNCFFKPPLDFKGFPNLEELCLHDIDFGANMCGNEIYFPQLKKLSIHRCTNVHNFNMQATKLQSLLVISCPIAMLLRWLDSPCLFVAAIAFKKPIEDFAGVGRINLGRMLSTLSKLKDFYIDNHFLKFLVAAKIPKLLPQPIDSLKNLGLVKFQMSDLNHVYGALCLLRNSPNLEMLRMYMDVIPQVYVGPPSNYLESPNCLDCTLNQLQIVEITYCYGSRPELLFVKLLLAHSPSLKKFTIRPSRVLDVEKRLDIAKDVMQFPRASPKAKVFYLDP